MKAWTKAICVFAVAALAALCLTACGSSSGGASGSGASSAAEKTYDSIYVVKHSKGYGSDAGVAILASEIDYEYDAHGNNTKMTIESIDMMTKESKTSETSWSDFDEYGYPGSYVAFDGTASTTEWTIEDGHAVKGESSNGSTYEFTYADDGKIKSQVSDYSDGRTTTVEYDENGRQVSQVSEGGEYPQTSECVWTLDDDGKIVSMTRTTTMTKTNDTHSNEYTVEYDENGNIATVYRDGVLAMEYEYEKIDNPSAYAWLKSWNPPF